MLQNLLIALFVIILMFLFFMRLKINRALSRGRRIRAELVRLSERVKAQSDKCATCESPDECEAGIPDELEKIRTSINTSISDYNDFVESSYMKLFCYLTSTEAIEKIPALERSQYD